MFRIQSILLLLKVITVSNALLMWRPTSYPYKRPLANDNEIGTKQHYELSVSQAESSKPDLNANNSAPNVWNIKSWFSFLNPHKSLDSQGTTSSPIQKLEENGNSIQSATLSPLIKHNPTCFFSALPCSPRRKDAYYIPRRENKIGFNEFQKEYSAFE